jgi:hypothetical protein
MFTYEAALVSTGIEPASENGDINQFKQWIGGRAFALCVFDVVRGALERFTEPCGRKANRCQGPCGSVLLCDCVGQEGPYGAHCVTE